MVRRDRHAHTREIYFIGIFLAVLLFGYLSIWGPGGYLELKKVRAELQAQRVRVEALQRSNQQRLEIIRALRSSREALEKYAREKGYGRKNEIIQRVPQSSIPNSRRSPDTGNSESRIQNPE